MDFFILIVFIICFIYFVTKKKNNLNEKHEIVDLIKRIKDYEVSGDEFIALDLETTGLSQETDTIIEIAAIKFSNKEVVEIFHTLINPRRNISNKITKINGITNEMVIGKPYIDDVLPTLLDFIGDSPIIAHNAMFDIGFIKHSCMKYFNNYSYWINNSIIDTLKLSRDLFPNLANHKLGTVSEHIGITIENKHRSTDDALASAQIYIKYLERLEADREEQLSKITEEEFKILDMIKCILIKNNRAIDYLGFYKNSKYFDIVIFFKFLRIKLGGKKNYIISDLSISQLHEYSNTFNLEECPKSETGETRILINSVDDLLMLENIIIQSFDKTMEEVNHYKSNVRSAASDIQNYLTSKVYS